jgi:diguanylate cyclase (GGDEF)-like protein
MTSAPDPAGEARRLAALHELHLLDTPAEERFDRITRLAQRLFDVPISLVSLVDRDRQWFKSRQGLEPAETPREISFCHYTIAGEGVMQVTDATRDPRFAENPLVTGDPLIRFYAAAPLTAPDGSKLGTLCVIDRQPRELATDEIEILRDLADLVEAEIASIQVATTDELTGLANRRGFLALGEKLLDLCARQDLAATLLYADVDNLKPINDQLGHASGDRALRDVAEILVETFRTSDVLARVGGDEFCALLTGASAELDTATARLQAAVSWWNRTNAREAQMRLSLSIGAATFRADAPVTVEQLLVEADEAMYADKLARKAMATPAS